MAEVNRVDKQESEIVLSAAGRWLHQGTPFENTKIIEFFHRAIRKDENGEYYLYNHHDGKTEHVYFEVEDTAYFVLAVARAADREAILATINTGAEQALDLASLTLDEAGVLYCRVLDGDRARILPGAVLTLTDLIHIEESAPGDFTLEHQGKRLPIRKR